MNAPENMERLHALTSRFCDGDASSAECNELSSLLEGDDTAVKEYLAVTSLHLALETKLVSRRGELNGCNGRHHPHGDRTTRVAAQGSPRWLSLKWLAPLAVAVSLLAAAGIAFIPKELAPNWTARITETVDCDWIGSHGNTPDAATLHIGQEIRFNQGLMMLEFGNGAQVCLEAPVRFRVAAADRGKLDFGKLTALVPEQAHGFSIQMPTATVIDLGTSFGAIVREDKQCETHVFQGSVLVKTNSDMPQREWTLMAGSAIRFASASTEPDQLTAKPEMFVRASTFADPIAAGSAGATYVPTADSLVLWFDAATQLQQDQEGRIVAWGDKCAADNRIAENAWQPTSKLRPTWSSDAMAGRPAVHFDGTTYLQTTPLSLGDNITVICVVRSPESQSTTDSLGDILNFNGPPSLVVGCTAGKNVVGGLTATLGDLVAKKTGRLSGPLPSEAEPVVVAYAYGHSSDQSSLYLNGELVDSGQASVAAAVDSAKIIGTNSAFKHGFVGDLSELLVFNSTLSAEQCTELSAKLMEKYEIDSNEGEPRILSRILSEQK